MSSNKKIKKKNNNEEIQVIKANLKFFKSKAIDYNKEEPSYRPENIKRVTKILENLLKNKKNSKILDIGCGTGFIIDLVKKMSSNVYGIDISPEMLQMVNKYNNKIGLGIGDTANLPIKKNNFDLCTAYGFLHHLYDITPTIKEAYRCLKKGGIFYSDQDPNYYFWKNAKEIQSKKKISEISKNEIEHVNDPTIGYQVKKMKSLEIAGRKTILKAEFQKTVKGGFEEESIKRIFKNVGFKKISYNYEWYLGEGFVKHQRSLKEDKTIDEHLRRCLPLTRNLFKYVRIVAEK
jgi:ubiquinone/menaquinone biosynthesis C-methylase UbiE